MAQQQIRSVMSKKPVTLQATAPVAEAARLMRDSDIGDVLVLEDDKLCGIVTDRDIVVRCIAQGADPVRMPLQEVCTRNPYTLSPDDDVHEAVKLIREHAVRRVPIVGKNGRLEGIVSLGDLAQTLDERSALGQVSAAPPTH